MSTFAAGTTPTREELRRLIRAIEARPPARPASHGPSARLPLESALPGTWQRFDGSLLVRREWLPFSHVHGHQCLDGVQRADAGVLEMLAGHDELDGATVRDLLFLDIETTGLGGTGSMVFLVTTAACIGAGVDVRQYLAASPADEAALLARLAADIRETHAAPVLVTYNGRTFDAPVLDQRGTMHRLRGAFEAMPHLDLLRTVRRGYRGALHSCRLAHVEDVLLGVTRPATEIAGAEVPSWYFRFLRTGDARHLVPLIEHNLVDVLSLVALLARLAEVVTGRRGGRGIEHLAVGRLYASHGDPSRATQHLEVARDLLPPSIARDECLFALATLHRRERRHEAASHLWREIAARPSSQSARALIELAKHLEHIERDLLGALDAVERAIAAAGVSPALERRRARLAAKVERARGTAAVG